MTELEKVNPHYPVVMIRDKEDLMRGLNACKDGNCDDCPYGDIGCSSPLASDALTVIEELERQLKEWDGRSMLRFLRRMEF